MTGNSLLILIIFFWSPENIFWSQYFFDPLPIQPCTSFHFCQSECFCNSVSRPLQPTCSFRILKAYKNIQFCMSVLNNFASSKAAELRLRVKNPEWEPTTSWLRLGSWMFTFLIQSWGPWGTPKPVVFPIYKHVKIGTIFFWVPFVLYYLIWLTKFNKQHNGFLWVDLWLKGHSFFTRTWKPQNLSELGCWVLRMKNRG